MKKTTQLIALFAIAFYCGQSLAQEPLPPAKEAIAQQYAQERASGAQNPAPRNADTPFPIVEETPFETGIFNDCDSLHGAVIVNCWQGIVNGAETVVYAGSQSQDLDPQQGMVIVPNSSPGTYLPTPVHDGPVRIVAAQGAILFIVTADNANVLIFDVASLAFVSVASTTAIPTSGTGCNGVYTGTFPGSISVKSSQVCVFVSGGVTGGLSITGGTAAFQNATIGRNVEIGGGSVSLGPSTNIGGNIKAEEIRSDLASIQMCGAHIGGNIGFENNAAAIAVGSSHSCAGNILTGSLAAEHNAGPIAIFGNSISGHLELEGNTSPIQIFNNSVAKGIKCENNTSLTGRGNTASRKEGQCSRF